jgi:NAD-dependent SIR2 family protein deacetylase
MSVRSESECRGKDAGPRCVRCNKAKPDVKYDEHNRAPICNECWGNTPPDRDLSKAAGR